VESAAGALSTERREALEDIDPSWCPNWPVAWQRCFHLTRHHLAAGGQLPLTQSEVVVQGEDLGRWVQAQRLGWEKLATMQQWLLENVLGIEPAGEDEKPKPNRTHADKWAAHLAAGRQFFEREGHLRVPRKHIEPVIGHDGQEQPLRLGAWVANQRSRAASLTPDRVEELSAIGMRWT
jgi:hypothetical protein